MTTSTTGNVNAIQTFKRLNQSNVYCSDLIHFSKPPSFDKLIKDYENESRKLVNVSFKNREYKFAIHKYIKFKYFKDSIKKQANGLYNVSIVFVSPSKWDDPCESAFYEEKKNINGKDYQVALFCSTLEPTENEESAWKRNASNTETDEKTIMVSYDFGMICKLLQHYAQYKDLQFYLSMMDYSESRSYFKKQSKSYTQIEEYINDLSKKRKAFMYENEMRIFAVGNNILDDNRMFKVEFNICEKCLNNLIHSITLPPHAPIAADNPKYHFYGEIQDLDNFDLRIGLKEIFDFKYIYQSRLYQLEKYDYSYVPRLIKKYNNLTSLQPQP